MLHDNLKDKWNPDAQNAGKKVGRNFGSARLAEDPVQTFQSHGLQINIKENRTEAMTHAAGRGKVKIMHELAVEKDGQVRLALRGSRKELRLVTKYKHTWVPSRRPVELMLTCVQTEHRLHIRYIADFERKCSKNPAVDDETKVSLIHSLMYSRLLIK